MGVAVHYRLVKMRCVVPRSLINMAEAEAAEAEAQYDELRRRGELPPTQDQEEPMAKKTQGSHTLELTETELYELRLGIKHREHELELAHSYMKDRGLSTESPDERLRILRGTGPKNQGLMHKLGFVESDIKAPPEPEPDPAQLELAEEEEEDDG